MAQFRTTADIMDLALTNGGEVTTGTSPYETQVLNYLNRVHFALIAGGTIPLMGGKSVTVDEVWPWARSRRPLILELQPKVDTGTVTLTLGSESGTFSSAPTPSLAGWYLKLDSRDEWFRIASHTAGATSFELDAAYTGATVTGTFKAVKLDYDLIPDYIVIDSESNKYEFKSASAGATNTAVFTAGTYTPAQLATHAGTQITAATVGSTVTLAYDSTTRLFTLTNSGGTHIPQFASGSNAAVSAHRVLGFDDNDIAAANSHVSTYVLGGIARLIEPFRVSKQDGSVGNIYGIDSESFHREYPLVQLYEGTPSRFAVIREKTDGTYVVRFNAYPEEKTRIEVDYVPIPRDLKDNASSIPIVPRKWIDVLEDAATFYLMLNKSDDRMQIYGSLVASKIEAMVSQHRGALLRMGENFGRIIPRRDLLARTKRRLFNNGDPY